MSMEHESGRDIVNDVDETHEDEPSSIPVTGEEWWMKYFGLTEALQWPQEEVDDNSTSQMYRNIPGSSLNVSISGEVIVKIGYGKGQTTFGKMVEDPLCDVGEPEMGTLNQKCRTNMVRADTDITNYSRGNTEKADRSEDAKFDHKCQDRAISFSP